MIKMSLHPIQSRLKLFLVEKNEWICSELRGSLTQYPPFFQWFEEHEKKTRPLFSPAQEQDDTQRCRTLIYASSFLSISSYLRKAGGWRHLYFIKQTCICHRQKENTHNAAAQPKSSWMLLMGYSFFCFLLLLNSLHVNMVRGQITQ